MEGGQASTSVLRRMHPSNLGRGSVSLPHHLPLPTGIGGRGAITWDNEPWPATWLPSTWLQVVPPRPPHRGESVRGRHWATNPSRTAARGATATGSGRTLWLPTNLGAIPPSLDCRTTCGWSPRAVSPPPQGGRDIGQDTLASLLRTA